MVLCLKVRKSRLRRQALQPVDAQVNTHSHSQTGLTRKGGPFWRLCASGRKGFPSTAKPFKGQVSEPGVPQDQLAVRSDDDRRFARARGADKMVSRDGAVR